MINWSKGIVARYYATMVDPDTWRDIGSFDILGGSINYSDSGVRGSADINCKDFNHEKEYWIRIYLNARQQGEGELVPLFTGLASSPDVSYDGRIPSSKVQCFSVLSPADKVYLPLGWYAQMGSNGATTIRDLLIGVTPAPIVIDGSSASINQNIVAENGETHLSMVDKILTAINWKMYFDGDGTIHISPIQNDIIARFDKETNDVLEMSVSISSNWYDIPNVFRAVGSGISSIARDEDPDSKFSVPNRGREIWAEEQNCVLNNNEKISEYASRKLKELQNAYKTIDYTRRFRPGIRIGDIIWLNYPAQKLYGSFIIKSQNMDIGYGGRVSEQVVGV